MKSLKILITGATGQVGRRVVETLKKDSSLEVLAAVRTVAKGKDLGVPLVELDLDKSETFVPALRLSHFPTQTKLFGDLCTRYGARVPASFYVAALRTSYAKRMAFQCDLPIFPRLHDQDAHRCFRKRDIGVHG
jgi:nucleoside-diphosphate-sugar epimerase